MSSTKASIAFLVAFLAGGVGVAAPASADVTNVERIGALADRVVPAQLAEHGIPGAVVTVVSEDESFTRTYGYADVERKVPMRAGTGFFTGSIAKSFTAATVLQLVEAGKLDLSRDVNAYLTTFRIEDTFPGRPVTLHHLLTHTAGFEDNIVGTAVEDPSRARPLAETVRTGQPQRVRPPGTVAAYDNYGYDLAAHLVEVASGQPFDAYVEQHILQPLGMTGTSFAAPLPRTVEPSLATGYNQRGTPYARYYGHPGWGVGPVTKPADLARFMTALLRHDPRLGRGVAAAMQRRQYAQDARLDGLGYGLEEWRMSGERAWTKGGDVNGFHHFLALFPGRKTGVHVVYNGENAPVTELAEQVARRLGPGVPEPLPRTPAGDTSQYAGEYASTRIRGDLLGAGALFRPVTVESTGDGTIATTGLSRDPARPRQEWFRIGPGLFAERGGAERIAFDRNGLLIGGHAEEAATYQRSVISPYLWLLSFGMVVCLLAFAGLPIVAVVRRRPAWWLAWLTSALVLFTGFGCVVTIGLAPTDAVFLGSPLLTATLLAASAAVVLTPVVVGVAAWAWWKAAWGPAGRVAYSVCAAGALAFVVVACGHNVVGWPFT